jgi:phosphatidylglycerol:prolipoprotein diacylglycerol transferase
MFRWYALIVLTAVTVYMAGCRQKGRFQRRDLRCGNLGHFPGIAALACSTSWTLVHEYAANPIRALYIWEGGLAIWGAVVVGILAVAVIAWRRGWRLPKLLDAAAPGLVLAQAIGRIACIITGDAMGKPTNGPFGFAYTSPEAMVPKLGVYCPRAGVRNHRKFRHFRPLWQLQGNRRMDCYSWYISPCTAPGGSCLGLPAPIRSWPLG